MNSIYYHEDDHGMKLLIPEENLPFIWYEFEEIIGYDIEQKADTNATEIFSLSNLKIKLIERNIPVSDFEVHIPVKVSHLFRFKVSHFDGAVWCRFDFDSKVFICFDF